MQNFFSRAILRYCAWKGKEIPCAAIFSTFPTDIGMCCSFNMKAAEEIFIGDMYPRLVQYLQDTDKAASFNKSNLPDDYIQNGEPNTQPGNLTFTLNYE